MSVLENTYQDLKDLILQRTIQQFRLDPSLLEKWNPVNMVLKHSPWTSMQLILNQVADDNISDLFPTDWQPKSPLSNIQKKHFKVLTEVITEMFIQCGLVIEENVIEMENYQDFLKVLHHHSLMGNISNIQITHFIILIVYMSLCRQKHYTEYLEDRHSEMLKALIWMTLVIMSFRTTFSMKGGHNIINPYYKNLPSVVRRNLHVAVICYMEQDCLCANHVQCDTVPIILTSEVVLPSYQHFLERTHQTGPTASSESETLNQYGKTVLMLILARVNGYYSSYSPQTIMEEEQKPYMVMFLHMLRETFSNIGYKLCFPRFLEKA